MPTNILRLTALTITSVTLLTTVNGCSKKPPEVSTFTKETPMAVSLTLLKADAQRGRSSPIGNNYRPQVRFPRGAVETTCAVTLPASSQTLDPGQTTEASLTCDAPVEMARSKPEFGMFEGGKLVGQGSVRLP